MGTKISQMNAAAPATADEVPVRRAGSNFRVTVGEVSKLSIENQTSSSTVLAPTSAAVAAALALKAESNHTHIISDLWEPSKVIFFDPDVHTNLQGAIDAAEALTNATATYGVSIIVPSGDYSAQNGTIRKNVSLYGVDGGVKARIGSISIRPSSDTVGPKNITLKNISMGALGVFAEATASSGIYNTSSMFQAGAVGDGLIIENSKFTSVTANRVDGIRFLNCWVEGAAQGYLYCENVQFLNSCIGGGINWIVNETAAGVPASYSGGNLQFKNSHITGNTDLTKEGGSINAYFASYDTHFELVTLNGNCEVRVHGGAIETLTQNNSNNSFLERQAFAPYNPATAANWESNPLFVHSALDELAGRPPVFSDGTRPAANSVRQGYIIYNTTDNTLNVSDGSAWRDMVGLVT